jgi:uncharacterized protein (DUF433 family)
MDTLLSINLIATNPQVRSGRPYILGTTLTVADIITAKIYQALDTDGVADYFEIPLQHVHAALAYYYEHKAEIDEDIKHRRELADEMREKRVGSRHKPLFN